jgi:mRNA interferase YafQ
MKRRGCDLEHLYLILDYLARDGSLPIRFKPHKLSGEYASFWECHIEPDWLLIYDVTSEEILLVRTGTHMDLFE